MWKKIFCPSLVRKATIEHDIPIKFLVGTVVLTIGYITGIYHHSSENEIFPDVIPSHTHFEKNPDKPVNLVLSISKVYERDSLHRSTYIVEHISPY